ncbi:DNA polymerase [Shigella flexneri]
MLHNHSGELAQRLTELEQKAHELAGEAFNLSSPKQLQTILLKNRVVEPLKKTRAVPLQRLKRCWKSWRWTTRCLKLFCNTVVWLS